MNNIYENPSEQYVTHPHDERVKSGGITGSIAKVFLYMFIGLFITAVVAFGVGALVYYTVGVKGYEEAEQTYLIMVIVAAVLLLVDMLVINFVTLKGKHSIAIPAVIYAILVGVLFSMLTLFVDWELIGLAFGITALTFLVMSGIAFLTKGNLAPLAVLAFGLIIGGGLLALVNWIYMIATGTAFNALYWIVTFAIFAAVMLISIYDLWRIKKIAEAGALQGNVALYCAFTMYTDFINIFIRILYLLMILYGKKK